MHIEAHDRPRRRIVSLTPLIDVVFILLVFFMLASTFTEWRSLQLSIPAAASRPAENAPEPLVVRIRADGLQLDGAPLELEALAGRVTDALDGDPERAVVVRPADEVPLQRVVTVMERLHEAGGARISLQRER